MDDIKKEPKGYCLSLSDGNNWWITGDKDNARWLDKLAAIMELEECASNGSPELAFSKMRDADDAWDKMEGWSCYDRRINRIWYHKSIPDVMCEFRYNKIHDIIYINMWYALQPIYQRSIGRGGLPFHAGLAELDGRGVLLAASGDTGKSTCCRRLPDYWKPLCDDESLVVLDKQGTYRAHPFPTWSDHLWKRAENTWDVQYSVPLAGIFFLEQAEADEVVPIGEGEAAVLMNDSSVQVYEKYWRTAEGVDRRKFGKDIFDNACKMAKAAPAFLLRVSLHGKFWEEIEKALGE